MLEYGASGSPTGGGVSGSCRGADRHAAGLRGQLGGGMGILVGDRLVIAGKA